MFAEKVALSFLHGHSPSRGVIGVIAVPRDLPASRAHCRVETYRDGAWHSLELDFQGVALAHVGTGAAMECWVLGREGDLAQVSADGVRRHRLPGAGSSAEPAYGYVDALREVAGGLYACGHGRQVYGLHEGSWVRLSEAILTREEGPGFLDVDGVSAHALWAVGWLGEIWRYDGAGWQQEVSPTTAHLTSLRVLPNGDAWACGFGGVVLNRRGGRWRSVDPGVYRGNWYGLEVYDGEVYLAGHGRLARVDHGRVVAVETGLSRPFSTHRLHARDGSLWSVSENHLLHFDGERWSKVDHPAND